jgi:hypothetical protein
MTETGRKSQTLERGTLMPAVASAFRFFFEPSTGAAKKTCTGVSGVLTRTKRIFFALAGEAAVPSLM